MDTTTQFPLARYARPAGMTAAGRYAPLLESLPADIPSLTEIAHGLLIHEHMAHGYGVTLTEADHSSVHIRPVERVLAEVLARDGRPLQVARPPAARLPVNCRHFTVLMTENPDASHAELDRLCLDDERLRVPRAVRSAARGRDELLYPHQ